MKTKDSFINILVDSWYARSLPYIDFDQPQVDGFVYEYKRTQEDWRKSIKNDLKKYFRRIRK